MKPYYEEDTFTVNCGRMEEVLKNYPDNHFDSIVTDPPYGLKFMGKKWDYDVPTVEQWKEAYRVLKPGGYLLSFGGTRTYHRMVVNLEDAGFEIRDMIQWLYGCISEDTEILTFDGWKAYDKIKVGESVYSFNMAKEQIEASMVEDIFIYKHNGEMINLKNDNTDQLLTLNHKVILKEEYRKQANGTREWNCPEGWDLVHASTVKNYGKYNLPLGSVYDGNLTIGVDFAELLGWILSEGNFQKDTNAINIYQSSVNKENVDLIRGLLKRMKIKHSEYKRKRKYKEREYTEHHFYFSGEIVDMVKNIIPDKKPKMGLWNLRYEEKVALFNSLMLGDGSKKNGNNYIAFYQNDKDFLQWFQVLCHLIGKQARINYNKMSVEVHHNPNTQLQARHLKNRVKKYSGVVWSIKTNNISYIAKRSGKIFITGNSGFPKSLDVGKAVDKLQGGLREIIGEKKFGTNFQHCGKTGKEQLEYSHGNIIDTKGNSEWEGWGTALKPACEIVCLAYKPLTEIEYCGKMAQNIKEYVLCQLPLFAKGAERSLRSNQRGLGGDAVSALWNVVEKCNTLGDLYDLTVTLQSESGLISSLNIVLSWLNTLAEICYLTNKSTIETKTDLITELKILNSLPWEDISAIITHAKDDQRLGIELSASPVGSIFTAVRLKLETTHEHSVLGNAISSESKLNLLPDHVPICLARKPLSEKNVALNVLKWGTGGINVDGCRVGTEQAGARASNKDGIARRDMAFGMKEFEGNPTAGRWPANLIHDGSEEVVGLFPETQSSKGGYVRKTGDKQFLGLMGDGATNEPDGLCDSGSAARFFYCAKSSRADRNEGLDNTRTIKYNIPKKEGVLCKDASMELVGLLQRVTSGLTVTWLTGEYGESIMGLCPQASLSTTLTGIKKITTFQILPLLTSSLINVFTQDANCEMVNGGNPAENVENLSESKPIIISEVAESALGVSHAVSQMLLQISDAENWKQRTNTHSTVKPTSLMAYLCRLITPPGGIILDPFAGSFSTGKGCVPEGFQFVGIDDDENNCAIGVARIKYVIDCLQGELKL